jgi:26S proteasome regulatory subunit N5
MNDQTLVLSKKHSQLKQAITKMVQTVVGFLDETPDIKTKLSVIETLRTVTEGKIFVEVERARVTKILSDIKKQQGDIKAAAEILCELQVETFGSMDRREKTEFILAQVALCIENNDWTQAAILARKISTRYLSRKPKKTAEQLEKEQKEREKKKARGEEVPEEKEDDTTDLKLRYYEQQITLAKHEDKYLDACKHYRQVLDTEAVEEDPAKLHPVRIPRHIISLHTATNTFMIGFATHHLLCNPRSLRQRTTRSPPTHTTRFSKHAGFSRC